MRKAFDWKRSRISVSHIKKNINLHQIIRQTFVRNEYRACFISCTLYSQHVSAFTKSHLQVILYNTKHLKRSTILLQRIR
jgi:hypothetical protein